MHKYLICQFLNINTFSIVFEYDLGSKAPNKKGQWEKIRQFKNTVDSGYNVFSLITYSDSRPRMKFYVSNNLQLRL